MTRSLDKNPSSKPPLPSVSQLGKLGDQEIAKFALLDSEECDVKCLVPDVHVHQPITSAL